MWVQLSKPVAGRLHTHLPPQRTTHDLRQTIRKEEYDIDRTERELRADEPLDLAALHDSVKVSDEARVKMRSLPIVAQEIDEALDREGDQLEQWLQSKGELEVEQRSLKEQRQDLRKRRDAFNEDLQRLEVSSADAAHCPPLNAFSRRTHWTPLSPRGRR